MVSGIGLAILLIGGTLLFLNREGISSFFQSLNPAKQIQDSFTTFQQETLSPANPIFAAGQQLSSVVQRREKQAQIDLADATIEEQAQQAGFSDTRGLSAREEQALATDSGSVVIGSEKNVVQFGVIGNILPTDPSDFFIENRATLLTPKQLLEFEKQQGIGAFA